MFFIARIPDTFSFLAPRAPLKGSGRAFLLFYLFLDKKCREMERSGFTWDKRPESLSFAFFHFHVGGFTMYRHLAFLIAILTALSAPSLVSAQALAYIDCDNTTKGTNQLEGNWIVPAGKYTLTGTNPPFVKMGSIVTELRYLSGGQYVSWAPPASQNATWADNLWLGDGWTQLQSGRSYLVVATMYYYVAADADSPWVEKQVTAEKAIAFP